MGLGEQGMVLQVPDIPVSFLCITLCVYACIDTCMYMYMFVYKMHRSWKIMAYHSCVWVCSSGTCEPGKGVWIETNQKRHCRGAGRQCIYVPPPRASDFVQSVDKRCPES